MALDRTIMLRNNPNYRPTGNQYVRTNVNLSGSGGSATQLVNFYNEDHTNSIENQQFQQIATVNTTGPFQGGRVFERDHEEEVPLVPGPAGANHIGSGNPVTPEVRLRVLRAMHLQDEQRYKVYTSPDVDRYCLVDNETGAYKLIKFTREYIGVLPNPLALQPIANPVPPPVTPAVVPPARAPVGGEVTHTEVNLAPPTPNGGGLVGGFGGFDNPPVDPPANYGPAQPQEVQTTPAPNRPQITPLHVRNLTNEIRPLHVKPLKRVLSPVHVKGQLKTRPLKRVNKKLPPLRATPKAPEQAPKEMVKVTTPPKKVSQPEHKEVKPAAPQPTVNINVAEKKSENTPVTPEAKGARAEQKSDLSDLEKLVKILQALQPKQVSKSIPQMPQLVRMLSESPKGVSTPETTTYIQIPDIDKITKMIDEIQLYIRSQEKKTEREGDTYTLIPMPDGRIVDRNEETIKVLRELKETLEQEKAKGETNTYIQIPEQSPTYIQLPEEKNKEEHVSYIQLPEEKNKEEHVSYIQLPEEKNKEEHVSYIQLPEGKGTAAVTENEETYIKLPHTEIIEEYAKKAENKGMTEKREEVRRVEPVVNTPQLPIMGMAPMPMPMPMPPVQPQQPIIINQGMSEGETKSSFWSNFFKVLLILLLLASLIGIGYLMYKNAHTQQQDEKPKPEPKPDSKPDPEPTPEVTKEVKVEGNPEPSKPVPTNEGETLKPVCPDGQNIQLNVDADKVNLGADTGNITQTAKDAINLEQVGTRNKLVSNSGTIDTSRIIIDNDRIQVREWGDITQNPRVYEGTIQSNGKALINGTEYTITDANGKAYSQGAIDIANQTTYSRNNDQTLSTDFGTLKQDLQINKNDTFTLSTKTENGTVIANNSVDDISNNTTIQNMLKDKLNDTSITEGEKNRIMDALDDGKLNNSYLKTVSNSSSLSLNNSNSVENSAGV